MSEIIYSDNNASSTRLKDLLDLALQGKMEVTINNEPCVIKYLPFYELYYFVRTGLRFNDYRLCHHTSTFGYQNIEEMEDGTWQAIVKSDWIISEIKIRQLS